MTSFYKLLLPHLFPQQQQQQQHLYTFNFSSIDGFSQPEQQQ